MQLAKRASALESVKVLYQDDRDGRHPDRWRIYRYRVSQGHLEILIKGKWCNAGHPSSLENFQEFGYTHCNYGFVSNSPYSPPGGFNSRPKFLIEFGFLELENYGAACGVLGLNWPVTKEGVKSAYKAKAKETHPDAGGSSKEFNAVQEAYELLLSVAQERASP